MLCVFGVNTWCAQYSLQCLKHTLVNSVQLSLLHLVYNTHCVMLLRWNDKHIS